MGIDIGKDIQKIYSWGLLDRLLKDKTTGRSILWATDAYSALGMRYGYDEPLSPALITGANAGVIQARAQKGQTRRDKRTRQHGEVCTPLWVVKKMVDYADEVWFGAPDRFFIGGEPTPWVRFDREDDWQRYVDSRRLEITCGEAPYLVTRYDVETGEEIPLARRIGILDRKLRVVNENAADADWLHWTARAFEACYGYELQGDSLLTARVNLLMTFRDYYEAKWHRPPSPDLYRYIGNRIVWNIWQMDGLTSALPCAEEKDPRLTLADFSGAGGGEETPPMPPPRCRIYNWRRKRSLKYLAMQQKGAKRMAFDVILGNPPYQDEMQGTSDNPIYNAFMNSVFPIASIVELITPARFLFNAGKTPKKWNQKMLSDEHFKVLFYEQDSSKIFANTDIKGGVAITLHDNDRLLGAIQTFTTDEELNDILKKVRKNKEKSLCDIVFAPESYKFTKQLYIDHPEIRSMTITANGKTLPLISKGHDFDLTSNIFDKLYDIVFFERPVPDRENIRILGRKNNARACLYIKREYIAPHPNLEKYKIFFPKANGAGKFGEIMTEPDMGEKGVGHTQTFISIGAFNTRQEAENLQKYLKCKFARALLYVLKVTQDNKKAVWKYVPLQDFTPASDIDWSQPVAAIDRQLYAKYGLDEREVAFIESHVKEME